MTTKKNKKKWDKEFFIVFLPSFLYGVLIIKIFSLFIPSLNNNLIIQGIIYFLILLFAYFILKKWDKAETKKINDDLNTNIEFILMDIKNKNFEQYVKDIFRADKEIDLFDELPINKSASQVYSEDIFYKLDYGISNLKNKILLRDMIDTFIVAIAVLTLVSTVVSNLNFTNQSEINTIVYISSTAYLLSYLVFFIMQDYLDKKRKKIINKFELLKCKLKIFTLK